MGFLMPKAPKIKIPAPPPPPPPAPTQAQRVTTAVKGGAGEIAAAAKRKGRRATVATGPLGLTEEPELGRKTLLGA